MSHEAKRNEYRETVKQVGKSISWNKKYSTIIFFEMIKGMLQKDVYSQLN